MTSADSARRRRCSSQSGKYDPVRSFGIRVAIVRPGCRSHGCGSRCGNWSAPGCARDSPHRTRRRPQPTSTPPRTWPPSTEEDQDSPEPTVPPASQTRQYWVLRSSRCSSPEFLRTDLCEDHAVAVSHHDATLLSGEPTHHVPGRNSLAYAGSEASFRCSQLITQRRRGVTRSD